MIYLPLTLFIKRTTIRWVFVVIFLDSFSLLTRVRPPGAEASTSKCNCAALARPWQAFITQLSVGCPLLQPGKGRLNPSYPLPSPFFTSHWLLICPAWLEGDRWECWPSRVSGELQTTRGLGAYPFSQKLCWEITWGLSQGIPSIQQISFSLIKHMGAQGPCCFTYSRFVL